MTNRLQQPQSARRIIAPGSLLTAQDKVAIKNLPLDTPIQVQQTNPKRGKSYARYEAYKGATTVSECLDRTERSWSDFINDFERGYVSIPATAVLALLPAFMLAALDSDTATVCSSWSPVPAALPLPGPSGTFEFSSGGRVHPTHVHLILEDMQSDPSYNNYMHAVGYVGGDLPQPVAPVLLMTSCTDRDSCIPPANSAYAPDGFSVLDATASVFTPSNLTMFNDLASHSNPNIDGNLDAAIYNIDVATANTFGVSLTEFAELPVDQIENALRQAEHLLPLVEAAETYINLAQDHIASEPDPATLSNVGAPSSTAELRRHPDREGYINAGRDEIKELSGPGFNTIKLVPTAAMHRRAQERGMSKVLLLPSMFVWDRKLSGRFKGRLVACQTRDRYKADDTRSPTASLCSVRWHGCLCVLFRMESKQLDATKAYCRGSRDPAGPSIFLRLPTPRSRLGVTRKH